MGLYFSGHIDNDYKDLYQNKIYNEKNQFSINEYSHIKMLIKNAVEISLNNNLGYFFTVSCIFSHYDGCSICLKNTYIKILPTDISSIIEAKLFFEIINDVMNEKGLNYIVNLHTISTKKGYYLVNVINNH